jgi:plastocyanin
LVGTLQLLERGNRIGPATDAVAWVVGVKGSAPRVERPMLASKGKRFEPHVIAVSKGTAVSFPNYDRIYHNAFSRTPSSEFDLGLYQGGASREKRFTTPGLVRVFCNIHAEMAAYVMVLDETAHGLTDARGVVRIASVPPGIRRVRLWHEKTGESELTLEVAAGREIVFSARLDGSRYRKEPHTNKYGQDYPRGTRY